MLFKLPTSKNMFQCYLRFFHKPKKKYLQKSWSCESTNLEKAGDEGVFSLCFMENIVIKQSFLSLFVGIHWVSICRLLGHFHILEYGMLVTIFQYVFCSLPSEKDRNPQLCWSWCFLHLVKMSHWHSPEAFLKSFDRSYGIPIRGSWQLLMGRK